MTAYFAHSANPQGQKHDLLKHLTDVAKCARDFASKFGAGELGYWAGLWHDLGKFTQEFQDYLDTPAGHRGPDHSTAGAIHASPIFDELARLVAGHHSGLPDNTALEKRINDKTKKRFARQAIDRAKSVLGPLTPETDLSNTLPPFLFAGASDQDNRRALELLSRMVFSALTDADFLDTEKHFNGARHARRSGMPSLQDIWPVFLADQNRLSGRPGNRIQEIRHEIYQRCLEAAQEKPGIFTLTVPTGGGKTRSGLAFALKHALEWKLDRVIVAIPYTSIIEQTVEVYRAIFKDFGRYVLEHHSAIGVPPEENSDPVTFDAVWSRLASENWDAPIVVTTTVQLFESLFANRPARCRKLHNVTGSVLILDEVQTLPVHLLTAILEVIQQLADNYRVTVVLCTATQPALTSHASFRGLRQVHPIIRDPTSFFTNPDLKRVDYELPIGERWTWQRVAEEMVKETQCLTILNTKKDAFALLDQLRNDPTVLHLSTQMCGVHRLDTLKEVKRRLAPGVHEPCRLVATQVVEAGVDLDFPLVLRAVGPLDRIVQAAGRCNREGNLKKDGLPARGRVVIFDPAEGGTPPGVYETAMNEAVSLLRRGCDLHDPETFEKYFRQLFGTVNSALDKLNIQAARARFDYPLVAEKFRMIEDDTAPCVVRPKWNGHEVKVDRVLGLIRSVSEIPQWAFRELQPYVVSIRKRAIIAYQCDRLLAQVVSGIEIWEWHGGYDKVRGLVESPLAPDKLVV